MTNSSLKVVLWN